MSRLADKWLWWRHAWFFNWAHKPLCEAYHEDVLRLGRLRLCRGCAALWAGALVVGPLLAAVVDASARGPLFVALLFLALTLSHPALHSRWSRGIKDLLRLASGSLPTLAIAMLFGGAPLAGGIGLAALGVAYATYRRLRATKRLHKCESCPELGAGVCSGYAVQAQAIREWEEVAAQREMARRLSGNY